MATETVATANKAKRPALPTVRHGMRGNPIACDCCDKATPGGWSSNHSPRWVWSERDVGPASFAWVTCPECSESETALAMHWTEKAMKRAKRHGKSWANAVEAMIMRGYN